MSKYYPNTKTKDELERAEIDVKKGENISPSFSNNIEMNEYLYLL